MKLLSQVVILSLLATPNVLALVTLLAWSLHELLKLLNESLEVLHSGTSSKGGKSKLLHEVSKLSVEAAREVRTPAGNPIDLCVITNAQLSQMLADEDRSWGWQDTSSLLDEWVNQRSLPANTHGWFHSLFLNAYIAKSSQGNVDHLEDFLIPLAPCECSNLMHNSHWRVHPDQDIESCNPQLRGLSRITQNRVENGESDALVLISSASKGVKGHDAVGIGGALNSALNVGSKLSDDSLVRHETKGDKELILPWWSSLGALELTNQVGDPLFSDDISVGIAKLSKDCDGVRSLSEGAETSLIQKGAEAHDGNVVQEWAFADLVRGYKLEQFIEKLLGRGDDVLRHPVEDVSNLALVHFILEDHLLQELHALGISRHQNGVKENIFHWSQVFFWSLEFGLQLRVKFVEFFDDTVSWKETDATSSAENLHGHLLLVNVNTLSQLSGNILDQLLKLTPGLFSLQLLIIGQSWQEIAGKSLLGSLVLVLSIPWDLTFLHQLDLVCLV